MDFGTLVAAMSIPSAITGFCFWLLESKINKRQEEETKQREERQKLQDERESAREKHILYLVKKRRSINSSRRSYCKGGAAYSGCTLQR